MSDDLERDALMISAQQAINAGPFGTYVYFKFTCEQCGFRCVLRDKNSLYEKGECTICKHITTITQGGFMLVMPLIPPDSRGLY